MERPLRVLLVDDSPFDRGFVRRELRKEFIDAEIFEPKNEAELAELLEQPCFDLVVTDYQIRWTDGLAVLRSVKVRQPQCPVLMFTATGSEEIAVEAMKSGLDDYIIKNVEHMVRLRRAVKAAVDHSQTRARAAALESRLASLLSHLQVGVFLRNRDGEIIEANDAAVEILGCRDEADLIGRRLTDFLSPINKSRAAVTSTLVLESQATRADGEQIWIAINEREVAIGDGDEIAVEGLLEDVTARKAAEDELRRLHDEMAHVGRINSISEMAAGISHELNQPLTAITNYADLLRGLLERVEFEGDDKIRSHVRAIGDLAYESGQMVHGLRQFVQRRAHALKRVRIGELVRSTMEFMQFELRRWRTTYELVLECEDLDVMVDPVQIRQVLVNLVGNALDAMAATRLENRRLTISMDSSDDHVVVSVRDYGCGIADDFQKRLFDPFVTSKTNGTGIGLSLSERIVKAHDGKLAGWNNPDLGATFEFTLPIHVSRADASAA